MRAVCALIAFALGASMLQAFPVSEVEPDTIQVDGVNRSYLVHVPRCHRTSGLPVLLMLHGRGASALSASEEFGWIEKADEECFFAVFPQALPIDPSLPAGAKLPTDRLRGWPVKGNDVLWWTHLIAENVPHISNPKYPPIVHPLDAPFLEALIDQLLRRYKADAKHIYVVGFSRGAEMASDLAQFARRRIAAVAIIGSVGVSRPRRSTYRLSTLLIFGTQDFPSRSSLAQWDAMPPIAREKWYGQDSLPTLEQDLAAWAQLDGCTSSRNSSIPWGIRVDWTKCEDSVRVSGISVEGLGHEWPGSRNSLWDRSRPQKPPLRLTDEIWRFFSAGN
jgi:poly(3-hydroxybutyrate) depolymerase